MTITSIQSLSHNARVLSPRSQTARRGFTLTEIALVLAVAGLILGGIWAAAATVYENNKTKNAIENAAFIVSNYKTLFSLHGVDIPDAGPGGTDITCGSINGVNDGFFPSSMGGGGCTAGSTGTYPVDPWGGYVQVTSNKASQGIGILMTGMPQDACIRLAVTTPETPDIIGVSINGGAPPLIPPIIVSTASAQCDNAGYSNSVLITYQAR